jgi:hypothetical protein
MRMGQTACAWGKRHTQRVNGMRKGQMDDQIMISYSKSRNARFVCSISPLLIPNLLATVRHFAISHCISFSILAASSFFIL